MVILVDHIVLRMCNALLVIGCIVGVGDFVWCFLDDRRVAKSGYGKMVVWYYCSQVE